MGIFRSNPIADGEREVADLARRAERLEARITESESELATAQRVRREALLADEVDAGAVERATDNVHAIDLRIAGLVDGLAELGEQRRIAEAKLASAREAVERAKVADMMAATNAELKRDLSAFQRAASNLLTTLGKLTRGGQPIGAQYRPFVEGMIGEIGHLLAGQEQRQASVAAGEAPLPGIAVAAPIVPTPPIERQQIFALKQLAWRDDYGAVKTCLRGAMVDLPTAAAQRALALGFALAFDDPRIHSTVDSWGHIGVRIHGPTALRLPLDECVAVDPPGEPITGEVAA